VIVEPASLGQTAEISPALHAYWVKLWRPKGGSWSISEWRITEAVDVVEAIGWARQTAHSGDEVEVFAEYETTATRADGSAELRRKHVRVYGAAPDEESSTRTITFSDES